MSSHAKQAGYVVPTYREPGDTPWYHFLHGNVPDHQIDFMYRAEVPQGPLTRQHFSHLARLMKYIEPQAGCPYAFAIGNLSRDDTQHEPGHGGVALMFGLRIQGITDHAGRQDPPFAHAVAAIDRKLDRAELLAAASVFHRHVLAAAQSAEWYRSYVRCAAEAPSGMAKALAEYVAGFSDLPSPPPSSLGLEWTVGESTPPPRIVIVHDDDAPFGVIAACATKIAAVLFPSDIRWSAISNGREADLPNGVTVRLVAASNVTAADQARGLHRIEEVPDDEAEIARQLFGVGSTAAAAARPAARGWRDEYAGAIAGGDESAAEAQRTPHLGEATLKRAPAPMSPASPPLDAEPLKAGDRTGAGLEEQSEIDVDVDATNSEGATLEQLRSTPLPTQDNRAANAECAPLPPASNQANDAGAPADTGTVSAGLAQTTLKAALPFKPTPTPTPTPASFAVAPTGHEEVTPSFRKSTLGWKGPAAGLGFGAMLIVVLYLLLSIDQEHPAPDPPLPPAREGRAALPTVAPTPTIPPTATPAPTTTATSKARAPRPPFQPRRPEVKKPSSVFDTTL